MLATAPTISGKPLGLACALSSNLVGIEARPIRVEVSCNRGPAFFQLVGLAETAVREARVRVASALACLGVLLDEHAVTVNLAPADVRKSGASLDLALALGILGAIGRLPAERIDGILFLGELGLDGAIRPIRGVLPRLVGARQQGVTRAIVPGENGPEAALVEGLDVGLAPSLAALVEDLEGRLQLRRAQRAPFEPVVDGGHVDLRSVRGQGAPRRAAEVAAAGSHNLLLVGPPGSGKTLLARTLPTVLPRLRYGEAIEATAIHSVAGLVDPAKGIVSARPFRAPHHSASAPALVGGGEVPRPGEVSLAHQGVLFLDELPEFPRSVLESLRQPLEDGHVAIARARARVTFPARPLVVGAANPCPCGYLGHPTRPCECPPHIRRTYARRLSGPLVDRFDLQVRVQPVNLSTMVSEREPESSSVVRRRVETARHWQEDRFETGVVRAPLNAALDGDDLRRVAHPDARGRRLLTGAVEKRGLSARGYVKALRVARTIADLSDSPKVRDDHVAEALSLRALDLKDTFPASR